MHAIVHHFGAGYDLILLPRQESVKFHNSISQARPHENHENFNHLPLLYDLGGFSHSPIFSEGLLAGHKGDSSSWGNSADSPE